MNKEKRKKLETAGWSVGSASEFLGLTPQETEYIELKYLLSKQLKQQRESRQLSQQALASQLASSQSRIAKMEAGSADVTIDLLIKALFAVGMSRRELGRALAKPQTKKAIAG
jgi:predicted XRE-type DNA-binding protein